MLYFFVLYLLLVLLFPIKSLSTEPDYGPALKTAANAALIQSGLEADYFQVQSAFLNKTNQWARDNGLSDVVMVGSAIVPVLLYKKVRIHTGSFTFEGKLDKVEGLFQIQF